MRQRLRTAIDVASAGCISGTLAEWPFLQEALWELGHDLPPETPASELVELCKRIENELRAEDKRRFDGVFNT